ncbi:polycystic kidney disease protein 1-like 2 [Archocentrus centrarchus]|uniref:polycystic kidney disease protein 1-like 2 n=1 Tax=Archocentrus centrarchus TaxID=63155 RepID=UPI0011EA2AC6|nr:polycystic kidney disease protein 1-like 2 [Archocentrus centrarchus]XP_030613579.1 polycystic kidney disease protein 1-like 2 [Archocentrus centrarchus]
MVKNSSVQVFLKNITREWKTSFNHTWWLGERVGEDNQKSTIKNALCTYMKLNPLQFVTSDCNQQRSFLCTHSLESPSNTKCTKHPSHTSRPRPKRDVNFVLKQNPLDMVQSPLNGTQLIGLNIDIILQLADKELNWNEVTPGQPTEVQRKNFISALMTAVKLLEATRTLINNNTVNHIINCSSAILSLSLKQCPDAKIPTPSSVFDDTFQVFKQLTLLQATQGPQTFVMKHPLGTIYQTIQKPAALGNAVLGSEKDGEFVKLPSNSVLGPLLASYSNIVTQMTTFFQNPHPSNDSITGTICSLSFNDGQDDIKVGNLTEMIEIFLPRPNAPEVTNTTVVLEKDSKSVTTVNVSDPNMTIFFSVEPSVNVSLVLLLSRGSLPNTTYYSNRTILNYTVGFRWMITPEMLKKSPGVWYIDVRLYSEWQPNLKLKISTFMSKCLFWDINTEAWRTEGCMVGEESTPYRTQCLCNHLTLFGSSFFVMPNFVDVSRTAELFATVNQNYVVLSLLCAFFGLYLITLLWACYADRRAHSKRKMTFLEDNHPGAQYNYLIGVQTGRRRNAGTSANVTVKLIGSEAESSIHTLTDPDKPVFERGSVDMFLLASPFPLGEVHTIRLQHDSSGGHPSWYINKVTIQDLQTRHLWHFFCDCWLSADRGDGMTKRTFGAAKTNEIASFRNIFQTRTSTGFRDEHIWVSIVDPPSRSPFTRAQRVSCCMCLLLCTMAINIAFWNITKDASSPVLFSLGSITITWQEFMVGVQSGLLMFPINILIITIFRSIRPRVVLKSKKDDPEENLRPPIVNIPTILRDTEAMISLVSMSPRNNMLEMHRLESSADLGPALERVNGLIQFMQGESESDYHWVYCSKFLLAGLCHLLMCLEKLDGRHFPNPDEYQQVLNFTNVLVRKAEMVFSSHLAYCPPPVKKKKKKTTTILGCWLPWWFVFVGWFLLLSISGISTFFTLLYGFQYGKEKSIKWVMSLGLSLFQSIFVLQPLKVIGVAVFFALLLKPVAVEESEEVAQVLLEQQEKCRQYCGRDSL